MKKYFFLILLFPILLLTGCSKDFLDKKQSKSLLVPTTLTDFHALMDNVSVMNQAPSVSLPATDDFFTTDAALLAATMEVVARSSYIWKADIFEGGTGSSWIFPYKQIFYANIVLEGLKNLVISNTTESEYNDVKGEALFFRAIAYFHLLELFTSPYQPGKPNQQPGVPLRLTANVNERPGRGTVDQVYEQIIKDLEEAASLLVVKTPVRTRPGKQAALALLARIYQTMEQYDKAAQSADAALQINSFLLDYNTLITTETTTSTPFPAVLPDGNAEVIFYAYLTSSGYLSFGVNSLTNIDTLLYSSYQEMDLRKLMFFAYRANTGITKFKGSYSGKISPSTFFAGLATDELFLIRAECSARRNDADSAMADLNRLLTKRWKTDNYIPYSAVNGTDALKIVLNERRKQLVGRNLRWTDLRRLNKDPAYAKSLKHYFKGQEYVLNPGDNKYVYPIPDEEIAMTGIEQNAR